MSDPGRSRYPGARFGSRSGVSEQCPRLPRMRRRYPPVPGARKSSLPYHNLTLSCSEASLKIGEPAGDPPPTHIGVTFVSTARYKFAWHKFHHSPIISLARASGTAERFGGLEISHQLDFQRRLGSFQNVANFSNFLFLCMH
jgi:hypothetical protein